MAMPSGNWSTTLTIFLKVCEQKMDYVYLIHKHLVLDVLDNSNRIPVDLRAYAHTGTVQDDPFDEWVASALSKQHLLKIHHAGKLTSPDIVIHDVRRQICFGLEVKKLDAKANGTDPRGLTIDYNSTVPCGSTQIKVGDEKRIVPCYYFFALLFQGNIVTSVLCHGDYLNNDYELHKDSKTSNVSTYGYGSYGEASIRHRKMYTFPNPLNSKLAHFAKNHSLIVPADHQGIEDDRYQSISKHLRVSVDGVASDFTCYSTNRNVPDQISDIFQDCKTRKGKDRSPYMVQI